MILSNGKESNMQRKKYLKQATRRIIGEGEGKLKSLSHRQEDYEGVGGS